MLLSQQQGKTNNAIMIQHDRVFVTGIFVLNEALLLGTGQ